MYAQEGIKPYDKSKEKGEQVEQMFDNIAHSYDLLNHRLSWGIDRRWRRKAIDQLLPLAPKRMLDVATGTGDFAILAARRLHPQELTGSDISESMMDIARQKVEREGLADIIELQREDCMALTFADNTFDAVTSAFGIRNFPDLDKGLHEMYRVLRPGGQLSIVELCQPMSFPMKQLFYIYSHTILPTVGRLISKDGSAYHYLTETIEAFPQGEKMVDILKKAGFRQASFKRLTFGICTMYLATK